jgi:hypothetical protein
MEEAHILTRSVSEDLRLFPSLTLRVSMSRHANLPCRGNCVGETHRCEALSVGFTHPTSVRSGFRDLAIDQQTMSETPSGVGVAEVQSAGRHEAREASKVLAAFGARLGWGLIILGILVGLGHGLAPMVPEGISPTGWIMATMDAASWILAFGLAGRCTALVCRLVAALIIARIEQDDITAERLIAQAIRGVDLLEHLVQAGSPMTATMPSSHHAEARRALSLAEIERSLDTGRWAETESLLE